MLSFLFQNLFPTSFFCKQSVITTENKNNFNSYEAPTFHQRASLQRMLSTYRCKGQRQIYKKKIPILEANSMSIQEQRVPENVSSQKHMI